MIEKINLNNILFLDIETVPEHQNYGILEGPTEERIHQLKFQLGL